MLKVAKLGRFAFSIPQEIKLKQVVPWKLIPRNLMQSNTTNDGNRESWVFFHGKSAITNPKFLFWELLY